MKHKTRKTLTAIRYMYISQKAKSKYSTNSAHPRERQGEGKVKVYTLVG